MTATRTDGTHRMTTLIPAPVDADPSDERFEIDADTEILVGSPDAAAPASALAETIRGPTGYAIPEGEASDSETTGNILLSTEDGSSGQRSDGYELAVQTDEIALRAKTSAGLFAGVASIRQLLPPAIESPKKQPGPWIVHGGTIRDAPRFGYRGAQLDVARHFFTVAEVKRFTDLIAAYKINHLHLHLTDNEGWRLEIEGWPALTEVGGATDIEGGSGGYYTQDQYREIVRYAAGRGITIVPEIDMPAHMGAAVTSYPDLAHGDVPDAMPADSELGTLAVDRELTYEFVEDVIDQVARLTPGPYIHIGADEAHELTDQEYQQFIERVLPLVPAVDKRPIAWQEIAVADPPATTIIQYWKDTDPDLAGYDVIFSPNTHTYLNFRYDEETPPDGPETWGRRITSVPTSYDWDPGVYYDAVPPSSVLGTEFELWSEELATFDDVTYMALPRMAGIAERGWSPTAEAGFDGFARRVAMHGPRWSAAGFEFYRSAAVDWSSSE